MNDDLALRLRMKEELRRQMQSIRARLPSDAREERARSAVDRLLALPEWKTAATVAAYVAMPTEVNVSAAVDAAWKGHKCVAFPRVEGFDPQLHLHDARGDLEDTAFGCQQPQPNAPRVADEAVDLIVCPALAVDPSGYRIGWGKGYYDRLLARVPRALAVAVVFDFQIIADAPWTADDVPVARIVSDRRVMDCRTGETL